MAPVFFLKFHFFSSIGGKIRIRFGIYYVSGSGFPDAAGTALVGSFLLYANHRRNRQSNRLHRSRNFVDCRQISATPKIPVQNLGDFGRLHRFFSPWIDSHNAGWSVYF